MNAQDFLKTLQRHEELFDALLAFVPPNTGGSNLNEAPPWMAEQFARIGMEFENPPWKSLRKLLETVDWASGTFGSVLRNLPSDARERLELGENLAVGCSHSSEFNGAVYDVPGGEARVIALAFGAKMILENIATLVLIHAPPALYRNLVTGGHQSLGYREPLAFRLNRYLFEGAKRRVLGRSYTKARVASETFILFRRYVHLGVADVSDVERELMPLPLVEDIRRVTHPLEPGAYLAWAATRFLVLHECGHVLLDHRRVHNDPRNCRLGKEFEADKEALRLGILAEQTEAAKCLICLGAWLFLRCADWISRSEAPADADDHPAPSERLQNLKNFLMERENANFSTIAIGLIDLLDCQFSELWSLSEWMRGEFDWNSLDLLVEQCVKDRRPDIFVDQFARWVLFGIPQRLCRTTARLRVSLEKKIKENVSDEHIQSKLQILNLAYEMAGRAAKTSLAQDLERAYVELAGAATIK